MNTIEYRNNKSGINNLEPIWKNKRKNVFRTEINFLFLCLFSGVVKTDLSSHNHKYFINPSGEDTYVMETEKDLKIRVVDQSQAMQQSHRWLRVRLSPDQTSASVQTAASPTLENFSANIYTP